MLISNWHLTMGWSWVAFIKMHFRWINLKRSSPTLKLVNFGNDESQGGLMSIALFHHSSLELNTTVHNIQRNLWNMGCMRQLPLELGSEVCDYNTSYREPPCGPSFVLWLLSMIWILSLIRILIECFFKSVQVSLGDADN